LRQHDFRQWTKADKEAVFVRNSALKQKTYRTYTETRLPEVVANILVCLIHQTNYLLDRQLDQLSKSFLEKGGFAERLYWMRKKRQ